MKISREVKTGILVILGLILIVFTFNYLKGRNLLDSSRKISVIYDNVEGLDSSAPVTINGHVIGKVLSINFKEDSQAKLNVTLLIEDNIEFSINSKAELYETGLIGGKAVAIIPAFDDGPNAKSGHVLQGVIKEGLSELVNRRLTPLQEKIEATMVSADSLVTNLNSAFDAKTKSNLQQAIAGLNSTLYAFRTTSTSLNKLLTDNNIESSLANFNKASQNLSAITDSIAKANLTKTISNLQTSLDGVSKMLASIESGKGTMGKLVKDEKLYDNLEAASKQLEELLQDFKLNPKRYVHFSVFGKKTKIYDKDGNEIMELKD